MGIPHLNGFLKKHCANSIIDIALSSISGKKIAIDISIYLYKYTAEKKLIENMYLMLSVFNKYNIIPVFIFDGKPPPEKRELLQKRKENKTFAEIEYNRLNQRLLCLTDTQVQSRQFSTIQDIRDIEMQMDRLKPQFIYITKEIINSVKELLRAYGATYYDSPGEADQLCAMLVKNRKVWACMSDDMDMFAYGCDYIIRNFNVYNHTATVYSFSEILKDLNMTQKEFRQICVLSGTDYNYSNNHNNSINLYKSLGMFNKFKKSGLQDFNEWIKINAFNKQPIVNNMEKNVVNNMVCNMVNNDLIDKLCNMFDLDNEMHQSKLKVFENVKIVNGKIMTDQLNAILAK